MFFVKHMPINTCGTNCVKFHRIIRRSTSFAYSINNHRVDPRALEVANRRLLIRRQHMANMTTIITTELPPVTYLDIPDKSENDKKIYKTLYLRNGLRALLVSDPSPIPHDGLTSDSDDSNEGSIADSTNSSTTTEATTSSSGGESSSSYTSSEEGDEKLAACAILIDVGSFAEPEEYQGLAHFLEHMIFMGSEKYPLENAFDAHIKKCGGFSNANTECEETLFYFEVSEQHLNSSLDYFTALMKAPLMRKEAMTRERFAVESEFQQIVHDDETRRDQLLASLATEGFPHATFAWGNLKSLKEHIDDDNLHKILHDFRKEHYSAHRMVVCLQARLPIEELEALVMRHFADIPSNDMEGPDFSIYNYENAFREEFYKEVYFVKPVENVCKLELTWVLPSVLKYYRSKPDQFLSYLMGYEGDGSLCAYLRKKLWGLELLCGIDDNGFDSNSIYALFNICIFLTEDGFKHLDEVIGATFAFIKLFSNAAVLKQAYTELQQIEETAFRFQSQKAAFDNVQNLVVKTKYYPPKDILTSTDLYYNFDEKELQDIICLLNQFKFNIMITSQQKYDGIVYDKREKWFNTEYATIQIPEKWKDLWNNSIPIPELFLPKPNQFISKDFSLYWVDNGKPEIPLAPKKLLQSDTCELWFRQDDKFELPEGYMHFYFISPLPRQSAKNDVLCALYANLVKFRLVEELYPATVAGLSYQFYAIEKGIVLKINGYNEKLHLIVDIITKAMTTMSETINDEMLDVFIKYQKKNLFNSLIKAKTLNKDIRLSVIEHIHWPMTEKYKALNQITLQDLRQFCEIFTCELYVQALMQGNFKEETAHNVMNSVLTTLNCSHIREVQFIENRTVQLPQGTHYIRCQAINDKDPNTVVTNYYQIGPCTVRVEAILDLLIMFVEEPLFDQLRTKEQLGYYVNATMRVNYAIAGYSITVNSQETKTTAKHVEERIEAFRCQMMKILEKMSDEEFDHVRESLIKIKMVVDMSLDEEVARNWGEITTEEYFFDRRRKEVEVLRTINRNDIIEFLFNNERTNLRKLSVQVIGHRPPGMPEPVPAAVPDQEQIDADVNVGGNSDAETNNEIDVFKPETVTPTVEGQEQNKDQGIPATSSPSENTGNTSSKEDEKTPSNEVDEELFNKLSNKIELKLIPNEGDATTITDIKDFKENLHVYPITKTKLDAAPSAEFIEDC